MPSALPRTALRSPQWTQALASSKFKDWPNYGHAQSGHIGIRITNPGFRNCRPRCRP